MQISYSIIAFRAEPVNSSEFQRIKKQILITYSSIEKIINPINILSYIIYQLALRMFNLEKKFIIVGRISGLVDIKIFNNL